MELQPPRFFLIAAIGSLFLMTGLSSSQALSIDTRSQANLDFFPFGELKDANGTSTTATYGQTITVPAGETVLNSFSFQLDDTLGTVNFAAYVAAWDGSKAMGPILYTSALQSLNGSAGYQEFTFLTGGLQLASNSTYVLFLSTSNFFDTLADAAKLSGVLQNPYAGGRFVYSNNGSNFGQLTTSSWDSFSAYDAAFSAIFSATVMDPGSGDIPVPEPSSALIGICLASAASFSRRWNKNKNFCV